jgi:hypothetical protein
MSDIESTNNIRRKGYFFDKTSKKWKVQFYYNKNKISLGYFNTELEAKNACDKEREKFQKLSLPNNISEYRDIPEYNGKYKISPEGKIISLIKSTIVDIKLTKNIAGYLSVLLTKDNGKRNRLLIHRVLYSTFIEQIPLNMDVDHIDRNILNNKLSNLRLLTRTKNIYNSKRMDEAKGYTYNKRNGLWIAQIKIKQKNNILGSFKTEEEAREAYLRALYTYSVLP